jgi:hypothetical protein
MAERSRNGDTPKSTTPERFAETIPPEVASNHSFSIQAIFELQRAFGKVERAVENLEKKADEQAKSLKNIERTIALATGAFLIISAIIGLAIKYGLDMLAKIVEKSV